VALDDARDHGRLPEALGTVAGDDTLFIVTSSATAGGRLARKLESMLEI
jgi:arginine repressor